MSLLPKLDADEIAPHLYLGSYPHRYRNGGLKAMGFDTLVLAAEELQAEDLFEDVEVYRVPLFDVSDPKANDPREILKAAKFVAARIAEGKNVLVTCAMGMNRSALVLGLALRMRYPELTGDAAVELIRSRRSPTLVNPTFETIVRRAKV